MAWLGANNRSITSPPGQVTGLVAQVISSTEIDLAWASVFGATGYTVRRNGGVIATPSALSYQDMGLSPSTLYTYAVAAVNTAGEGPQSTPVSATTASTGQAWTFSDLITGFTPFSNQPFGNGTANWGTQNDGSTANTAVWDPSGFLRITSPSGPTGVGTFGLRYGVSATGLHECCIQYDIRRSNNLCSKQIKTYGWGQINGGNTSNATFGCTMGGYAGTGVGVYYGDFATGSNDATVAYATSGYPTNNLPAIGFGDAFSRTPYPTQAVTLASSQDITGTVWETWMIYFRASSAGSPDGQITIWKMISGVWVMVMNMTNLWNCSTTTPDRGGFGIYEFSANSGFHEDYRKVYQMFAKPVGMGI